MNTIKIKDLPLSIRLAVGLVYLSLAWKILVFLSYIIIFFWGG